jgi:hypothetical protein
MTSTIQIKHLQERKRDILTTTTTTTTITTHDPVYFSAMIFFASNMTNQYQIIKQ